VTGALVALVVAGAAYLALVEVLRWLIGLVLGLLARATPELPRARARWMRA
jgi:hypothetical protein